VKTDLIRRKLSVVRDTLPLVLKLCTSGRPKSIFRFDGGIGDDLICTAVLRELYKRTGDRPWMLSHYPDLFRLNPDISVIARKEKPGVNLVIKALKLPVTQLSYAQHDNGRDIQPNRHVMTVLCESLGISGRIRKRPYLFLTNREKTRGRIHPQQIAIQTSGLAAKYAAKTKEWYPDRFQKVVNAFRGNYQFVQIGAKQDPLLEGVVDMRGKTAIRESAAILQNSLLFIGLAGFLQHLARSVDCRSVIIYGGRELPSQTGYACNRNMVSNPACSPCWLYNDCPHGVMCMSDISVEQVVTAAKSQLDNVGTDLTEDLEDCFPEPKSETREEPTQPDKHDSQTKIGHQAELQVKA